ncbi:acyl-CoA N-acyltransferase [Trichoderma sp. SZMC 28014]
MTTSKKWATIKTTLPERPQPPNATPSPVTTTDRLLIRPLVPEDAHSLQVLRTQQRLSPFLRPNDEKTYNAICLKDTGEMIGMGGCHQMVSMFGWPAIGVMIRREFWGQGLATEFVKAWLEMWCKLPRAETELQVDRRTLLPGEGEEKSPEQMIAFTRSDNIGSQRVLEKAGFERFLTWEEADMRDLETLVTLIGYRYVLGKR